MISRLFLANIPLHTRRTRIAVTAVFFLSVYMLSWLVWLPQAAGLQVSGWLTLLAGFTPSLVGLLFIYLEGGSQGLADLSRRLTRLWLPRKWYLFCTLGPAALFLIALGVFRLAGGAVPRYVDPTHIISTSGQWYLGIVVFLYIFVFSALGEEIGWRGYALPKLAAWLGDLRGGPAAWGYVGILAPAAVLDRWQTFTLNYP
jgi:uncharacterized protein